MDVKGLSFFFYKSGLDTLVIGSNGWRMVIIGILSRYLGRWRREMAFERDTYGADPKRPMVVKNWIV
jgi:hypothetical protein